MENKTLIELAADLRDAETPQVDSISVLTELFKSFGDMYQPQSQKPIFKNTTREIA